MGRRHRAGAIVFVGLAVGAWVGLGALWAFDRARTWETPRLASTEFTPLRDPGASRADRGWAVIAVNPGCSRCMETLRGLPRDHPRLEGRELVVLVVDQARAPSTPTLDAMGGERVWWDRRGVWRHRWGHRIYGEILRFDHTGNYLGTTPPSAGASAAGQR